MLAGLSLAGGTAYAAGNDWQPIRQAWSQLTGAEGSYDADTPTLVAAGTTSDGQSLQLWRAGNGRGGECLSVRVVGYDRGLDSCSGGHDVSPATNVQVEPAEAILGAPDAWVVYGHLDAAAEVSAVVLDRPAASDQRMPVDVGSGYWIGSFTSSDVPTATLQAVDESGRTLGERALNAWDSNLTVPDR